MNNRHSDHISIPSIQQTEFVIPNKDDFLPTERFLVKQSLFVLPRNGYLVKQSPFILPSNDNLVKQTLFILPSNGYLVKQSLFILPSKGYLVKQTLFFLLSKGYLVNKNRPFMYFCARPEPHYASFTSDRNQTHSPEKQNHTRISIRNVIYPIVFILNTTANEYI